jgi:hypothetical protein
MNGGHKQAWERSIENIRKLSDQVYTTVGVVLNGTNAPDAGNTIMEAARMGVHDIRIIPAAQYDDTLMARDVAFEKYPILQYRMKNAADGITVRGLEKSDAPRCYLSLDDMVVAGDHHWPCIIYMREGGAPIGKFGKHFRRHRERWSKYHNPLLDPICRKNCLDVCRDYNNKAHGVHK